ncbi:MAG: phosphotransferase enzyme family protein [Phycisphaerae bacterium]
MGVERERFSPSELAVVLSHYDLGVIESAKEFARGSRRSPKLLLRTAQGRYLLKRRAHGRARPARVTFAHTLLWHLRQKGFPVPELLSTRDGRESTLTHGGRVYELFEYVPGERYDGSLEQTAHAGKTLARFHRGVADFQTAWQPPPGGYHDSAAVRAGLNSIPTTIASHDSVIGQEAELLSLTQELYERYDEAAEAVNRLGYTRWPRWIIHGDWHPGNMRFRRNKVAVVLDFDATRRSPTATDVANGMLQFSILMGGDDPGQWPEFFDQARMRRFLMGYASRVKLDRDQRRAIPHLMIESLIAECVVPVAATGSLGQIPGFGILQMVRRKVHWLLRNFERLTQWIAE